MSSSAVCWVGAVIRALLPLAQTPPFRRRTNDSRGATRGLYVASGSVFGGLAAKVASPADLSRRDPCRSGRERGRDAVRAVQEFLGAVVLLGR